MEGRARRHGGTISIVGYYRHVLRRHRRLIFHQSRRRRLSKSPFMVRQRVGICFNPRAACGESCGAVDRLGFKGIDSMVRSMLWYI